MREKGTEGAAAGGGGGGGGGGGEGASSVQCSAVHTLPPSKKYQNFRLFTLFICMVMW